jgi:hypothetical protein
VYPYCVYPYFWLPRLLICSAPGCNTWIEIPLTVAYRSVLRHKLAIILSSALPYYDPNVASYGLDYVASMLLYGCFYGLDYVEFLWFELCVCLCFLL